MFKAISKVGNNIGVFDTDDYSVEFHNSNELIKLLNNGIVIEGLQVRNKELIFSPVKVVVNYMQVYYDGIPVFNDLSSVRKENSTTFSVVVNNKRIRFRIAGIYNRYNCLIRMSNGLYTALPKAVITQFYQQ